MQHMHTHWVPRGLVLHARVHHVLEEAVAAVEEAGINPQVCGQQVARMLLQEHVAPQAAEDVGCETHSVTLVQGT